MTQRLRPRKKSQNAVILAGAVSVLSDAAVELLRGQLAARRPTQAHVFPGARPGGPLSEASFKRIMLRLGAGA